jgi:cob(I)alamin adenosyltransferase
MVKIYTKKGDDGTTGLLDGSRVPKDHPRCQAYGEVDELGAGLGVARAFVEDPEIASLLLEIQKDLFAVGAQLADPKYGTRKSKEKTVLTQAKIEAFEKRMDRYEGELPPLRGFILRCGTRGASFLHLACTVCRRAERKIVSLSREATVPPLVVPYMNRLSDLLFVLARVENRRGGEEQIEW